MKYVHPCKNAYSSPNTGCLRAEVNRSPLSGWFKHSLFLKAVRGWKSAIRVQVFLEGVLFLP